METDGEWRKKLNECETSLRRLCEQARVEDSPERLSAIGAMTVRIELELLEELQLRQGAKAGGRTPRLLRGVLGFLEAFLRDGGGFFQWAAAGLRVRLGRPIGELLS
jgi:hypothetical protein